MSNDPITPSETPHLPSRVLSTSDEGRSYRRLRLERPEGFGYRWPGQYVALAPPTPGVTPRYFALASAVHEERCLDFLIKKEGDTAQLLADLPPGAPLLTTNALGAGFAVDRMVDRPLVVFATGSGIAPIVPLLAHALEVDSGVGEVWLYYGEQTMADFAFTAELKGFARAGARVTLVCAEAPEATGGHRYVQEAFAASGPPLGEACVVLCGSPAMEAAVETLLKAARVPAERILRNYESE